MKEYKYKGYIIKKNGTKEYPYNIYMEESVKLFGVSKVVHSWVAYGKTLKDCKFDIDYFKEF